ncbi:hypothetical protein [Pseudomonas sp.]|uniref:hypothetical protein n=1 Tax=Pseudomonas sp. TaxID=306 RepID=UPI0019FE8008|nr:hypothetical protein [Pseudomonas sp.]MBF0675112.1 hypothetical protein [Pseudomonas sp.]MBF0677006.1 hypothetical protein [Pseudomonas sp.]
MVKYFRSLFGVGSFNDGYITIVYRGRNESVVIHDTLSGDGSEPQCGNTLLQESFIEPSFDVDSVLSEPPFNHGALLLTNPATGLPMIDDFVDAGGNLFGFGD